MLFPKQLVGIKAEPKRAGGFIGKALDVVNKLDAESKKPVPKRRVTTAYGEFEIETRDTWNKRNQEKYREMLEEQGLKEGWDRVDGIDPKELAFTKTTPEQYKKATEAVSQPMPSRPSVIKTTPEEDPTNPAFISTGRTRKPSNVDFIAQGRINASDKSRVDPTWVEEYTGGDPSVVMRNSNMQMPTRNELRRRGGAQEEVINEDELRKQILRGNEKDLLPVPLREFVANGIKKLMEMNNNQENPDPIINMIGEMSVDALYPVARILSGVGNLYDPNSTAEERLGAIGNLILEGAGVYGTIKSAGNAAKTATALNRVGKLKGIGGVKAVIEGAKTGNVAEAVRYAGDTRMASAGNMRLGDLFLHKGADDLVERMAESGALKTKAQKSAAKNYWIDRANKFVDENPGATQKDFYDQFSVDVDGKMPEGGLAQSELQILGQNNPKMLGTIADFLGVGYYVHPDGSFTTLRGGIMFPHIQEYADAKIAWANAGGGRLSKALYAVIASPKSILNSKVGSGIFFDDVRALSKVGKVNLDQAEKLIAELASGEYKVDKKVVTITPESSLDEIQSVVQSTFANAAQFAKKLGFNLIGGAKRDSKRLAEAGLPTLDNIADSIRDPRTRHEGNVLGVVNATGGNVTADTAGTTAHLSYQNLAPGDWASVAPPDVNTGQLFAPGLKRYMKKANKLYQNYLDMTPEEKAAWDAGYEKLKGDAAAKTRYKRETNAQNVKPVEAHYTHRLKTSKELQQVDPEVLKHIVDNPSGGFQTGGNSLDVARTNRGMAEDIAPGFYPAEDYGYSMTPGGVLKLEPKKILTLNDIPQSTVGVVLRQSFEDGVKGWYDRATKTLGFITGKSDFSTIMHESFHAWTDGLTQAHKDVLAKHFGEIGSVDWYEGSARAFEKYVKTGEVADSKLGQVFDAIKTAIKSVVDKVRGAKADDALNPEVKQLFDEMLGRDKAKVDDFTPDVSGIDGMAVPPPKAGVDAEPASGVVTPPEPHFTNGDEPTGVGSSKPNPTEYGMLTEDQIRAQHPKAGSEIDGYEVGDNIPNLESIDSSLSESYEHGVRIVSFDDFNDNVKGIDYRATDDIAKVERLAEAIKENKRIDPLIVVRDNEGFYVLEGNHRYEALKLAGINRFPALIVDDIDSLADGIDEAIKSGKSVPRSVAEEYSTPTTEAYLKPLREKDFSDAVSSGVISVGKEFRAGKSQTVKVSSINDTSIVVQNTDHGKSKTMTHDEFVSYFKDQLNNASEPAPKTVDPAPQARPDMNDMEPKAPDATETGIPVSDSQTALANRITAEIRLREELGGRTAPDPETMKGWAKEAELVDVDELINRIQTSDRPTATAPESLALGARISQIEDEMVDLERQYQEAAAKGVVPSELFDRMDSARNRLVETISAGELIGTEAARTMVARKALLKADYSFAGLIQKTMKQAKKNGVKPSKADIARVEVMSNRIKELEAKLAELEKQAPETLSEKAKRQALKKETLDKEEASIIDQIKAIAQAKPRNPKMRGTQAGAINIGKSAEYAPLIKELVKVKIKKGFLTVDTLFSEVVDAIKGFDLTIAKQDFIDLLDEELAGRRASRAQGKDISARRALNKEIESQSTRGQEKAARKAEEKAEIASRRTKELELKREIAAARRDAMTAERKAKKAIKQEEKAKLQAEAKAKREAEAKAKKELKESQKQARQPRARTGRSPMTEEQRAKNLQKQIDDLNKKAEDGSLTPPEKQKLTPLIEDLTRQRDEALKNAKAASPAYQKLAEDKRLQADVAEIERLKGRKADLDMMLKEKSFYGIGREKRVSSLQDQKDLLEMQIKQLRKDADSEINGMYDPAWKKVLGELVGIPRFLELGLDAGALMRQGWDVLFTDPKAWAKAAQSGAKAWIDPKFASKIEDEFYNSPEIQKMVSEGLEIDGAGQHPEYFVSNLLSKIPFYQGAERFHKTFQNVARAEMGKSITKITKLSAAERKDAFHIINAMTGRGNNVAVKEATKLLGGVFTAPRMYAGQIEMMGKGFRVDKMVKNPAYRRLVARRTLGRLGVIAGLYEVAQLTGNEFGIDPGKSDFLKLTINGVVYDLGAGYTPYYRAILNTINGMVSDQNNDGVMDKNPDAILESVFDIAKYKVNPAVQLVTGVAQGKDGVGEPVFRGRTDTEPQQPNQELSMNLDSMIGTFFPMIGQEIYAMLKTDHYDRETKTYQPGNEYDKASTEQKFVSGALSFVGSGVSAYDSNKKTKFSTSFLGKLAEALNLSSKGEVVPGE